MGFTASGFIAFGFIVMVESGAWDMGLGIDGLLLLPN